MGVSEGEGTDDGVLCPRMRASVFSRGGSKLLLAMHADVHCIACRRHFPNRYRETIQALNFFSSVREKLDNPVRDNGIQLLFGPRPV